MIAHLRGTVLEKHPNQVIVESGGVGYEVNIPISTFTQLPDVGQEVRLRVYTHVREDALQLFGFATADEKTLFERLISVTGIGAKVAILSLSGMATADLVTALRGGDVAQLTRIPGIGKKTAERMVLELRDKLDQLHGGGTTEKAPSLMSNVEQDVVSALVNLGSLRPAAEAAVRKARAAISGDEFEPLFRKALELAR